MFKWLRGRNASRRVGVIESVQLDGKRSIKLVRRDNIEHLVLVGGRNDVVIEPNIMRRPVPKPAHRPAPEMRGLPPPGVPTREPLPESLPKSRQHDLGELTRRLEAELRGSPPLRRQSPPLRTEAGSSAQLGAANVQVEPRFRAPVEPPRTDDPERDPAPEAVPNDGAEKKPVR
jgi:flagellar protein FliO/FliZ